jgi:sarcosine oxidase
MITPPDRWSEARILGDADRIVKITIQPCARQYGAVEQSWDLVVVGLGAMGSATLWRAASRGVRALGIDRFDPPHDRGSTHGESRIIRTAYFEDPAYLPLLREAFPLLRALERESGEELLTMTGAAMIGAAASEVVAGALRTAQMHDLPHEVLDAEQAAQRFPQFRLRDDDIVFHERDAGLLRPEACVAAALRSTTHHGAVVRTGTTVHSIEPHGDGVRIRTDDNDTITARRAVICAGPWTAALLPQFPVPLWVERQVNAWFNVADRELYSTTRCPVFIREMQGGHHLYGAPGLDGATIKLAVHHEGARVADPDNPSRTITDDDTAPLSDHAAHWLHAVDPHPVRAITCLYTNTPDQHFVIDTLPDAPQITVISACSGHGFKFAAVIGDIAVDLAVGGGTQRPIGAFSLRRFQPAR